MIDDQINMFSSAEKNYWIYISCPFKEIGYVFVVAMKIGGYLVRFIQFV